MLAFAILGLLGVGLIVSLADDDDESTAADESVSGNDTAETIETAEGDDTIFAGGGNDLIDSGAGDDRVFGQNDTDAIFAGEGDDFVRGGAQDDVLFAEEGQDTLQGDGGDDVLFGADIVDTDGVFDVVDQTGFFPDNFSAFLDFDADSGEADTLNGGVGEDDIIAGSNDVVTTGEGEDIVEIGDWVTPGEPVTITDFNPSQDVIVYTYEGATAPAVFFSEDESSGSATIETAISDQENAVVAILEGIDFFDVSASNLFIVQAI